MMKIRIQSAISFVAAVIITFLAGNNANAQTIVVPAAHDIVKAGNAVIQLQNLPTTISWVVLFSTDGGAHWGSTNVSFAYSGIGSGPASETTRLQLNFNDTVNSNCYLAFIQANTMSGYDTIEKDGPFTLWTNQGVKFVVDYPDSANSVVHQDSTIRIRFSATNVTTYAPDSINLLVKYLQPPPGFVAADTLLKNVAVDSLRNGDTMSVSWKVLKTPTTQVRVFISTTDHKVTSGSATSITIQGAAVSILSPAGGDSVYVGEPDTIRWSLSDSVSADTVTINYSSDGQTFSTVARKVPSWQGHYIWNVPQNIIPAPNAEIVISADAGFISQKSNAFWVGPRPTVVSEPGNIPSIYLDQNYPNPFSATNDNSVTNIPFSLSSAQNISLRVFNVLGSEVFHSPSAFFGAGAHALQFNASQLLPGAYWYDLLTGTHSLTGARRMMLYVK